MRMGFLSCLIALIVAGVYGLPSASNGKAHSWAQPPRVDQDVANPQALPGGLDGRGLSVDLSPQEEEVPQGLRASMRFAKDSWRRPVVIPPCISFVAIGPQTAKPHRITSFRICSKTSRKYRLAGSLPRGSNIRNGKT